MINFQECVSGRVKKVTKTDKQWSLVIVYVKDERFVINYRDKGGIYVVHIIGCVWGLWVHR